MPRRLLATALLLAALVSCQPITPPVTPAASATAFATVAPTDAPPDRLLHPSRMSPTLGVADVMHIVCFSKTTTIAGYSYGLEWSYNTEAYNQCIEAKKI